MAKSKDASKDSKAKVKADVERRREVLALLELGAAALDREARLHWLRSGGFAVLEIAIGAGYVAVGSPALAMLLGVTGAVVAALWVAASLGGEFEQRRLAHRLGRLERSLEPGVELFGADVATQRADVREAFGSAEAGLLARLARELVLSRPSPVRATALLAAAAAIFWIVALIVGRA